MSAIDRAGTFRGQIFEYGLKEVESGAVAVAISVRLEAMWIDGDWVSWSEYGQEAHGDIWIVKKNGELNERANENLMRYAGWNGDVISIIEGKWQPTPVQVVIQEETYKETTRFRIEFVNDYERAPGAMGNVSDEKARQLAGRFGTQLRAIYGNVKRNGSEPAKDKPAPPPPSNRMEGVSAAQAKAGAAQVDKDGIPF